MAAVAITDLPAGTVLSVVQNSDGSWPNRPTSRTDLRVLWFKTVSASADPSAVTAPSVGGAYATDGKFGVS